MTVRLSRCQVPGTTRILGLHLNRKGNLLLVNCNDRVIRLFDVMSNLEMWPSGFGGIDPEECRTRATKEVSPLRESSKPVRCGGAAVFCACILSWVSELLQFLDYMYLEYIHDWALFTE